MEECEGRLEKGAEYVDVLQAQIDEMTEEISNMKRAEEVCYLSAFITLHFFFTFFHFSPLFFLTDALTYLLVNMLIFILIHLSIYLLTNLFVYFFTHALTCSFIFSLNLFR